MLKFESVALSQQFLVIVNAALAALLGSAIGWERDRAGKSVGPRTMALVDRKSTRLNSSHSQQSRMPSSA